MKKFGLILALAILLAAGVLGVMPTPSGAQGIITTYTYPPPPLNPLEHPWVGPNTPWVFYNGDWFLNGELYYYYARLGWAPYYVYEPKYIERPITWYDPRWNAWYEQRPEYWQTLRKDYPYWTAHRQGQIYEEKFYIEHHKGENRWRKALRDLIHEDKD